MIRDDDHADEEVDNFLLVEAASAMDRMIDLRTGSAVWLMDGFEATVFEHTKAVGRECHALKKLIHAKNAEIAAFALSTPDEFDPEVRNAVGKELAMQLESLKFKLDNTRANYRLASEDLQSQTAQTFWPEPTLKASIPTPRSSAPDACSMLYAWDNRGKAGGFDIKFDIQPTIVPGADAMPANEVVLATAKVTKVPRIIPSVDPLALLQKGYSRVVEVSPGTYSTRLVKRSPRAWTTAKNGNPRLQHTLMRLMLGCSPLATA